MEGRGSGAVRLGRHLGILILGVGGCSSASPPNPERVSALESPPTGSAAEVTPPWAEPIEGSGWFRAYAEVEAPSDESPRAALERAKALARRAALERGAPVSIKAGSIDFASARGERVETFAQSLVSTELRALVLEETVLDAPMRPASAGGGFRQAVTMKVRILTRPPREGQDLRVRLSLNRLTFRAGEAARVRLHVTQAATVQLINITESGAIVLLPNPYLDAPEVKAGEAFDFPTSELRERGVRLTVEALSDRDVTHASLLVIAVKIGFGPPSLAASGEEGLVQREHSEAVALLADRLGPLLELPAGVWAFDQLAYRVLRDRP